ncbi:hypothetical protein NFI96_000013 [Prochilodus magdalenae]|nr:hypothetical protein NFI96_000013 [Prochilodus magdalenae]
MEAGHWGAKSLELRLFVTLVLQICDKEWHYYVINVEFPAVTLFVDGVTYEPYLVTDDWPIHPSQIDVQLTVGACWQVVRTPTGPPQSRYDVGGGSFSALQGDVVLV